MIRVAGCAVLGAVFVVSFGFSADICAFMCRIWVVCTALLSIVRGSHLSEQIRSGELLVRKSAHTGCIPHDKDWGQDLTFALIDMSVFWVVHLVEEAVWCMMGCYFLDLDFYEN